ncbi:MAG TPA: site-specific integrase [Bryobacteraceae bacterium]|nr:site-specific integrase [Bryobacteraceae bacterium]
MRPATPAKATGSTAWPLYKIFKDLCKAAGLREIRFHDLRHSAAALLIAQGVHPKAIQELLRHASIQTTFDVYGHLFAAGRQETADKMDQILTPRQPTVAVTVAVKSDQETVN